MDLSLKRVEDFIENNNLQNIKTLYHYCSLASLSGILENKEIWLSCTASMNDSQEQKYFINNLQNNIQANISKDKFQLCNDLFDNIYKRLNKEYPFAFCLSELKDNAAQWERYADNAYGFSIGFNTYNLVKLLIHSQVLFTKVIYGYNSLNHAHYNILREFINSNTITRGFTNVKGVIDNILICASSFKHESFCTEQEWRISTILQNIPNNGFSSKYEKTNKNIIKKVIVVNLNDLCIKNNIDFEDLFDFVIIGPRSNQSVYELQENFNHLGYKKLSQKIVKSSCPLK